MLYAWDENALQQTAEVLAVINPGSTVDSIKAHIKNTAQAHLNKPGYLGTGGWYVTAYTTDYDDKLHMLTTIMAFTVKRHLGIK